LLLAGSGDRSETAQLSKDKTNVVEPSKLLKSKALIC